MLELYIVWVIWCWNCISCELYDVGIIYHVSYMMLELYNIAFLAIFSMLYCKQEKVVGCQKFLPTFYIWKTYIIYIISPSFAFKPLNASFRYTAWSSFSTFISTMTLAHTFKTFLVCRELYSYLARSDIYIYIYICIYIECVWSIILMISD